MQRESYLKVNQNTKTQLVYLLKQFDLSLEDLRDKIVVYLRFFDRTGKGSLAFSPEDQARLMFESLSQHDRALSSEYICDRGFFEIVRKRILAILIFILPEGLEELRKTLVIDPVTQNYLRHLENASFTRSAEQAHNLALLPQAGKAVKDFFQLYAGTFSSDEAFRQQGITLDTKTLSYYDRGVRCFLDPQKGKEQGLQRVLKRYLFARIYNNVESPHTIASHLSTLATTNVRRDNPHYDYYYFSKMICSDNPVTEIINLSQKVGIEGIAPSALGDKEAYISGFIFNLFLLDPYIPTGSKLYDKAMALKPRNILKKLRSEALCSTAEA